MSSSAISEQKQKHKKLVSDSVAVTKFAHLILNQVAIKTIKEIPKLPAHQSSAKKQSQNWLSNIWPLVIQATADVIDYGQTFQVVYQQLLGLLGRLEKGDQKAKEEIVQVVQGVLIPTLQEKQKTANTIAGQISKFSTSFDDLYKDFNADFVEADKVLTADNQQLEEKKATASGQLTTAQSYETAYTDLEKYALPATAGAAILFGPIGLLFGGLAMIGEGIAIGVLLGKYADEMDAYYKTEKEISDLNEQVCMLNLIEKQIRGLQNSTKTIYTAAEDFSSGWDVLFVDIKETLGHLTKISPSEAAIVITIQLAAANKEWDAVIQQAKNLQPSGGQIPHKIYATPKDMIAALKKNAGK